LIFEPMLRRANHVTIVQNTGHRASSSVPAFDGESLHPTSTRGEKDVAHFLHGNARTTAGGRPELVLLESHAEVVNRPLRVPHAMPWLRDTRVSFRDAKVSFRGARASFKYRE
jgi:hypothetical protein